MSDFGKLLNSFFQVLGQSEQELEKSRSDFVLEKDFNLYSAFDFFDEERKGFLQTKDLERAMQDNSLLMNNNEDFDAVSVFSILDIYKKGFLTREAFVRRLCASSVPKVRSQLEKRLKQNLSPTSIQLLFEFIKALSRIGTDIERAKSSLKLANDYSILFQFVDTENKGYINFCDIKKFVLSFEKTLENIWKALEERQSPILFRAAFNELIYPYNVKSSFVISKENPHCKSYTFQQLMTQAPQHKQSLFEKTTSIYQHIPDENKSVDYEAAYCIKNLGSPSTDATGGSLKKTLLQSGCKLSSFQINEPVNAADPKWPTQEMKKISCIKTQQSFHNEVSIIPDRTRKNAEDRLKQIENLARIKVYGNREWSKSLEAFSLMQKEKTKLAQLQQEKLKLSRLETQLFRSKSKITQLENNLHADRISSVYSKGYASPRQNSSKFERPGKNLDYFQSNFKSKLMSSDFQFKSSLIDLQYERIRGQLQSERRFKRFL